MEKMKANYRSLIGARQGARQFHVHLTELSPAGAGWEQQHSHAAEEAIFLLDGRARFSFAGKTHEMRPGDIVFFPAGVMHAKAEFLTDKVRYLVIRSVEPGDAACCCGEQFPPKAP